MTGTRKTIITGGLILGLVSAWATTGRGEDADLTGAELEELCDAPDSNSDRTLWCHIYVRGFLEGLAVGSEASKLGLSFCPPKNLSIVEGRVIVRKYLRDHSTELKLDARTVAARAFLAAYPCR
jgi:hypothetical protein